MTRSRSRIIFIVIFLALGSQWAFSCQRSAESTRVKPEQLRGLKSVFPIPYVSFKIPNYDDISRAIDKIAQKMLADAGLSLKGEQGAVLLIDVFSYPLKEAPLSNYALIQVRTVLSEEAKLERDPSLRNPHGYHTWDWDWVALVPQADCEAFIFKEVKEQIQQFIDDWRLASR